MSRNNELFKNDQKVFVNTCTTKRLDAKAETPTSNSRYIVLDFILTHVDTWSIFVCFPPQNRHSPANYVAKINETLKILYDNIPKAFVNLVEIFDIKPLAKVAQGFFCTLVTE